MGISHFRSIIISDASNQVNEEIFRGKVSEYKRIEDFYEGVRVK